MGSFDSRQRMNDVHNKLIAILIYLFNMPLIFAGTGYSQVLSLHSEDKHKNKTTWGAANRQSIVGIAYDPTSGLTLYATPKSVTSVLRDNSEEVARSYSKASIISVAIDTNKHTASYVTSDGVLYEAFIPEQQSEKMGEFKQLCKPEQHTSFTGVAYSGDFSRCLLYGKGVVPLIVDKEHGLEIWRGKNVKHD
jgi:hypothetical protein